MSIITRRTALFGAAASSIALTVAAIPAIAAVRLPTSLSPQERFNAAFGELTQAAREMDPTIVAWAVHRTAHERQGVRLEIVAVTDEAIEDAERWGDTLGYCLPVSDFVHYRRGQL